MRNTLCLFAILGLLAFGGQDAVAAVGGSSQAIMSTVEAAIATVNNEKPSEIGQYFTPDAVVVDNVKPFKWSGPTAAHDWVVALVSAQHIARIKNMVATIQPPATIVSDHDRAYASIPLSISTTMAGQPHHTSGLWALTLVRSGDTWKISSASWAEGTR